MIKLCEFIGTLGYRYSQKEKKRILENLDRVYPEKTQSDKEELCKQWFNSNISLQLECITEILRPGRMAVENLESYKALLDKRPFILSAAHLGNWELLGVFSGRHEKFRLVGIAKRLRSKALTLYIKKLREKMDVKVLWIPSENLSEQVEAEVELGNILGLVCDQRPGRQSKCEKVKFLGLDTDFVVGPYIYAKKYDLAIYIILAVRLSAFNYKIIIEPIIGENLAQKTADVFTKYISAYPDQWCWNYKRWRNYKD